jgi:hypothetical protein
MKRGRGIYSVGVYRLYYRRKYLLTLYREFWNIYCPCHKHRRPVRRWFTFGNTDRISLSVKFSREKKIWRSTVGVWVFFFPTEVATEMEIADDQYSDRHIPSVMPSVKMLPMNCVFYTDRMHPSVKLFNGVVSNHKIKPNKFSLPQLRFIFLGKIET